MIAPIKTATKTYRDWKNTFFDTELVKKLMDEQRLTVFKKVGVYGQKTIRSKLKPAAPRTKNKDGRLRKRRRTKYPRRHVRSEKTGLGFVLFGYEASTGNLLIGSVKFSGTPKRPRKPNGWAFGNHPSARVWVNPLGGKTIPQVLNEGGAGKMNIELKNGHTLVEVVRYREQPYVSASFDRTAKAAVRILKSNPLKN
mgnify:CR=1 FL=1|tara:strand:- start:955 stop:1545 length:591 start_codon:yes stop_codon:yes gene_type:complete